MTKRSRTNAYRKRNEREKKKTKRKGEILVLVLITRIYSTQKLLFLSFIKVNTDRSIALCSKIKR